jgi:RNA polymerase sigma factor (sigma-70 family)
MEDWIVELRRSNSDAAWDLFIARYRRVIFAAIHRYARDPDEVMDLFAWVCEALHRDDLRRLRTYAARQEHTARPSTWLVTVVRRLAVDWHRHHHGRRHPPAAVEGLTPLQQRILALVYVKRRPRVEAYETIRADGARDLSFSRFLNELRTVRSVLNARGRVDLLGERPERLWSSEAAEAPRTGETAERRVVLDDAVGSLGTTERRVIDLYLLDERPAATVARILRLPNAKAVYNRVYRALDLLRARLDKAGIRRGDL